jgi:hypothetical protein
MGQDYNRTDVLDCQWGDAGGTIALPTFSPGLLSVYRKEAIVRARQQKGNNKIHFDY